MPFHTITTPARWSLALLALLGLARSAHAQDYNGGTSYNSNSLYHGGRFTNAGTFTNTNTGFAYYAGAGTAFTNTGTYTGNSTSTDQFIGPGGAAGSQTLDGTTAPSFYNLTLANGTGQVFSILNAAGLNVANTLTLTNGKTTTPTSPAGAIRLGSAAAAVAGTLGASAGYIDGYLSKAGTTAFLYPLGASNQNAASINNPANGAIIYSPITLSNPSATTLRYVASAAPSNTSFTAGDTQPLATVSAKEYYPMSAGAAPAGSTIGMPYTNFGTSGTGYVGNPSTLTIAAFNSSTGKWENLSNLATNPTSGGTVTVTLNKTLTSTYTALALASTTTTNPLPVQLTAFTATRRGADGLLSWTTASEANSAYFEVQASPDGSKWQVLSKVAAAGSSTTPRDYTLVDREIARYGVPLVYYRLNQVDLDGKTSFSPVRTLAPDGLAWSVTAYPNPYATELSAQLSSTESGPITLTLSDVTGRIVLRREAAGIPGTQLIDLRDAQAMATGDYVLRVQQGSHAGTVHITKQ